MRPAILLLLTIKSLCTATAPSRIQIWGCSIEIRLHGLWRRLLHYVSSIFEDIVFGGMPATRQARVIEEVLLDDFAH